ncbi:MAG: hypothetical protein ACOZQL_16140 [Myxococcota bacterium]
MITSPLDAFDLVAHSEQLLLRLEAACAELSKKQGLKEEKAWLETARQRVATAREGVGDLLTRVLRLPELEGIKEDQARILQGAAVDAVERVHAGIAFAGGARAPLLEALYGKLKVPVLRRCDREDFEKFCTDFEKRLNTGYAKRMFADPSYAVVLPALDQLRQAFATWRGVFTTDPLGEAEAQALRDELDAAARRLELPCRQSRLLAQAALVPLKELLEESGIATKPKRRGPRVSITESDDDDHPLLEEDPADPSAPSPAELAELTAAAQAEAEAPEVEEDEEEEEDDESGDEEEQAPAAEKPRRGRKAKTEPAEA